MDLRMENKNVFQAGEFIDLVSRFDSEFPKAIQGASPGEIDELQKLAGQPLPESYTQFLSAMGKRSAWIDLGRDHRTAGTSDIASVIEFYEECMKTGRDSAPPKCIAISVFGPDYDVCLDLGSPGEPRLVISEGGRIVMEYAETLKKLLFRMAFNHCELETRPHVARFRSPDAAGVMDRVTPWAASLRFSTRWFSDRNVLCGELGSILFAFRQYHGEPMIVSVGSTALDEISRLEPVLFTQFGLRPLSQRRGST